MDSAMEERKRPPEEELRHELMKALRREEDGAIPAHDGRVAEKMMSEEIDPVESTIEGEQAHDSTARTARSGEVQETRSPSHELLRDAGTCMDGDSDRPMLTEGKLGEDENEAAIDPESLAQIRALLAANPLLGAQSNDELDATGDPSHEYQGSTGQEEEASLADIQRALDAALNYSAETAGEESDTADHTPQAEAETSDGLADSGISEGLRALLSMNSSHPSSAPVYGQEFEHEDAHVDETDDGTGTFAPGERSFPCLYPHCNKTFGKYASLKSHQTAHIEERPYRCHVCPMTFTRNHDLKRHVKIHTEAKAFKCLGCDHTFSRLDALRRHKLNKKSDAACQNSPVARDEEALALSQQLAEHNAIVQEDLRLQVEKGERVDRVPKSSTRGASQLLNRAPGASVASISGKTPSTFMGLGMTQLQNAVRKALVRLSHLSANGATNGNSPSQKLDRELDSQDQQAGPASQPPSTKDQALPSPVLSENLARQLSKVLASAIAKAGAQDRADLMKKGESPQAPVLLPVAEIPTEQATTTDTLSVEKQGDGSLAPATARLSLKSAPADLATLTAIATAAAEAAERKRLEDDSATPAFKSADQEGVLIEH